MMPRARLLATLLVAALVTLAAAPRAHAQVGKTARPEQPDDKDPGKERKRRAYALLQEGTARFDLGKFDEAIDLFQKAYEVYPYPEALYNIAQAHRMKKDYERAVFFYKSYLRNHATATNRATVEARITEMERLDAEQKASAKKPPQGTTEPPPPDGSSALPAPAPAADAGASPLGPIRPVTRAPWYEDGWGWALTGGGVLAAGVGAWLLLDGYELSSAALPATDQVRVDEERADSQRRVAGWAFVGAGSVAIVWGTVKLIRHDAPRIAIESARAPRTPAWDLVVSPRFIGVGGTF